MSRLRVSAAGVLGTAFVVLATACTNDFDGLFEGDDNSSSGGVDGGKADTTPGGDKDTGPGECSCGPTIGEGDGKNTKFTCPKCACKCPKIVCGPESTGGCTGTCEESTSCDVTCSPTNSCTLGCRSGASCILRCAKGFTCDLDCSGGKTVDCGGGVFACNTECP